MTLTLQRIDCAAGQRNVCVQGKELGLLFNASPHSVSLSFTFLSQAVFVNIVRSLRFIPSPCFIPSSQSVVHSLWSVFNTDRSENWAWTWYTWFFVFPSNYRDEKLCDVSKANSIANCIEIFLSYLYLNWNFYVHKFSCLTKSKAVKYMGVSKWDAIMYCENRNLGQGIKITSKVSSRKKHPDSRYRWWAIQLPMDIHKQGVKTNRQVEFQKTGRRPKAMRALFTHRRELNWHSFTQTSFHFGFHG